ncbi:HEPN domain-containing protein [uncultured Pedobacter sp.]|uniref:HEPN domain-containing protein n=1 Tax=uncultured Pedobacter sp. TaxID=246139 RepID=UPI0025F37E69|nr:HEPN domain-containing protein [uncultured Pedobacter sp.]
MKDELPYDIEKDIFGSLNAIKSLQSEKVYKVKSPETPLNNKLATIEKIGTDDFLCKVYCEDLIEPIAGRKSAGYGAFEDLHLESGEDIYFIKAKSVLEISRSLNIPSLLQFKLTHFQRGSVDDFDNKHLRLIIPVDNKPSLTALTDKRLKTGNHYLPSGLVEVNLNNEPFHLYKSVNEDSNYLIVESQEPITFDKFKKASDSLITAYALISGNLHLGEYFYHVIEGDFNAKQRVIYEKNEPAAITNVTLLNHIEFKNHLDNTTSSKAFHHHCVPMSTDVFSPLCQTIHDNAIYARCCRFIIEGHQSKQVLLKGGIYSIGIETIAAILYEENAERINPIEDKKLAKKIISKVRETIGEYDAFISSYGKNILDVKINALNSPTNAKKLSRPFELFGITLPEEDVAILNTRNKFLHGTSPLENNENPEELQAIVNKLLFMLMVLMFKHAGYSGHIIHYPDYIKYRYTSPYSGQLFFTI